MFHRDNITRKFSDEIEKAVKAVYPSIHAVEILVDDAIESKELNVIDCRSLLKESEKTTKKQQVEGVEIVEGINSRLINDRYRLDNFIV
jgi:chromosomal replication initiation ATPase DnaA